MHSSNEAVGSVHPIHQHNKDPSYPGPILPFWFLHTLWMSLFTGGKWYFFVVLICIARLLAWPKRAYAFSPEYIQQKTHTPFLAQQAIGQCKSALQCSITSHWSKGTSTKCVKTRKAKQALENREPCYAEGRDVNCQLPHWRSTLHSLKQVNNRATEPRALPV